VSKSDAEGGGASRVAEELTRALIGAGHRATHFSAFAGKGFDGTHRSLYGSAPAQRATQFGRRVFRKLGLAEGLPIELPAMLRSGLRRDFDVVHFHDLSTAISPLTLDWFSRHMPTFWTFHDCSAFTGGCISPNGCERYKTRCGSNGGCPQLHNWPLLTRFERTGLNQHVKTRIHAARRIRALAPSGWMADEAIASGKVPVRPTVVSNGVDINVFTPAADRGALRRQLGIPEDRPVVLLTAASLDNPSKGMRYAIRALELVADLSPFAIVVGGAATHISAAMGTIDFKATGYLSASADLARWYGAADFALNCTLADNQPLVVLESMACGVPTVAFATGGIPEMIRHEESGMLSPIRDVEAVAAAMRRVMQPGVARRMGEVSRERARAEYSLEVLAARHVALYEQEMSQAARR
jgi:glycosyltransferase involved in cell wall biosynthesis